MHGTLKMEAVLQCDLYILEPVATFGDRFILSIAFKSFEILPRTPPPNVQPDQRKIPWCHPSTSLTFPQLRVPPCLESWNGWWWNLFGHRYLSAKVARVSSNTSYLRNIAIPGAQCIQSFQILERSRIDWANTRTCAKWSRTLLVVFLVCCILNPGTCTLYHCMYTCNYTIYVMYTTIHSNISKSNIKLISNTIKYYQILP